MAQDPSDVSHLSENVEILKKAATEVLAKLRDLEANKDAICQDLRRQCGVYSPRDCYNAYSDSLKTLVKRLKRPLELPPHSIELNDDTKQLIADVNQVFQYGLERAPDVCFPRVVDALRVRGGVPPNGDGIGDAATRTPAPDVPAASKRRRLSATELRKSHESKPSPGAGSSSGQVAPVRSHPGSPADIHEDQLPRRMILIRSSIPCN